MDKISQKDAVYAAVSAYLADSGRPIEEVEEQQHRPVLDQSKRVTR